VVRVANFKEPSDIKTSPLQKSLRSKGREKALRRIIETHKSVYSGHHWRLNTLFNMEITECDDLEVEFAISINGREIKSDLQHPDSHFDIDTSNLYILESLPEEIKLLETARKLANVVNPKIDPSILCSQIRYAINPDHSDSELHSLLTYMGIDELVEQTISQNGWSQGKKVDVGSILDDTEDGEESQADDEQKPEGGEATFNGGPEEADGGKRENGGSKGPNTDEEPVESGKTIQEKRKEYFDKKRQQFYRDRHEFEGNQPFPEIPEKHKLTEEEWEEHKEQVMVFYNRQIRNIERRLNRLQEGEESFDIYTEDWTEISQMIRERDGYECRRCFAKESELKEIGSYLTVHHIVPRKKGGSNWPSNLITLCIACHREVESAPELL
jgi:hypothetical protein